jgi:hypothetical protein
LLIEFKLLLHQQTTQHLFKIGIWGTECVI